MSIDEELLLDEQETKREMEYIRQSLPEGMTGNYAADDGLLSWVLEAIASYYYESGVLEGEGDEVSIDMDEVAKYVCSLAEQEGREGIDPQDVRAIAETDLDFLEQD